MKVLTAPLGGLIGAIIGGVVWANYVKWTGNIGGLAAFAIGALCGIGIVLTGCQSLDTDNQKNWLYLAIGAAFFSILGILVGKYLDVQLNAVTQIAHQIIEEEPTLTLAQAAPIAERVYSGSTKWQHMIDRMEGFDLVFAAIAVIVSVYITLNRWIRKVISKLYKKVN